MAKTYIDTVKYIVHAYCEIDGLVEKPDVVGAIFGQTEGLIGDELDLRELQKNGRIGRIVVELTPKGGKSVGSIKIPSSLDMVETSILAASLETVDRVGPCEAKIKVEKIEDTRNLKRNTIVERAKELLKTVLAEEIPESREISEQVRAEVKTAELSYYGPEKLPAGPNIEQRDNIIIVEGRADVLNLLKNDISNVIGIGGANVSKTIIDLTKEKEVTVFLDGDRGGDIILAELSRIGDIDYVARAPAGKEVEELTRKEIIKCLRAKVPFEQRMVFIEKEGNNTYYKHEEHKEGFRQPKQNYAYQKRGYRPQSVGPVVASPPTSNDIEQKTIEQKKEEPFDLKAMEEEKIEGKIDGIEDIEKIENLEVLAKPSTETQDFDQEELKQKYLEELNKLDGTLKARIYSDNQTLLCEIPVRDIIKTLENQEKVFSLVFDGLVTKRVAELASQKGAKVIAAVKLGNVFKKPENLLIFTKE
ncbi:MAG: DNA primase DnaG [Candidatus Anstonellaceae archaeon]